MRGRRRYGQHRATPRTVSRLVSHWPLPPIQSLRQFEPPESSPQTDGYCDHQRTPGSCLPLLRGAYRRFVPPNQQLPFWPSALHGTIPQSFHSVLRDKRLHGTASSHAGLPFRRPASLSCCTQGVRTSLTRRKGSPACELLSEIRHCSLCVLVPARRVPDSWTAPFGGLGSDGVPNTECGAPGFVVRRIAPCVSDSIRATSTSIPSR